MDQSVQQLLLDTSDWWFGKEGNSSMVPQDTLFIMCSLLLGFFKKHEPLMLVILFSELVFPSWFMGNGRGKLGKLADLAFALCYMNLEWEEYDINTQTQIQAPESTYLSSLWCLAELLILIYVKHIHYYGILSCLLWSIGHLFGYCSFYIFKSGFVFLLWFFMCESLTLFICLYQGKIPLIGCGGISR